jgi:DNA-binding beta-propeller fold protein YncE
VISRSLATLLLVLGIFIGPARVFAGPGSLPFKTVADIELTGNATRLDYQSLDPKRQLLFIAHLGDSTVIAVDVARRRVIATIPDVSDVHGVLALPERGVVYASATGTNEVVAIDENTLKVVARMPGGVYPDGIGFDPRSGRLFVSDEHGKTETVIDTHSNQRIATIELGGEAGNTQYDASSGHMFVNVQTLGKLIEIDPTSNEIVRKIPVSATGCIGNHGLLIDASRDRAFIACSDSSTLLLLDLRSRRITGTWPIGEDPDVLAFDPSTNHLFIAAESGVISIFTAGDAVSRLAQAFYATAAHTVAVDPGTHLVYLPLENADGRPRLRIVKMK